MPQSNSSKIRILKKYKLIASMLGKVVYSIKMGDGMRELSIRGNWSRMGLEKLTFRSNLTKITMRVNGIRARLLGRAN